jgi:ribulose-phosphate 3-epimerase
MDGHFVPNISFGYHVLNCIKNSSNQLKDVHLMISDPKKYSKNFIDSGADLITFHYEALNSQDEIIDLIEYIHSLKCKVGISIKPNTPVSVLLPYLHMIDLVLIMSVEPGFGGQKFNENCLDKIDYLNKYRNEFKYKYLIEVDGGINFLTAPLVIEKGVDVMVVGSYLFNSDNMKESVDSLLK